MAGIIDIGTYIPWRRLSGKTAGEAWGRPGGGERTVAGFDEDSATMAVEAAMECLAGHQEKVPGALYFASVTAPYHEKSTSSLVAAAADLRTGIRTSDFGGSLRAGTSALLAALDMAAGPTDATALVCAADSRLASPGSMLEMTFGDGGAAVLTGRAAVAAELLASVSVSQDILDTWRTSDQRSVRTGDARFNRIEAYTKCTLEACKAVLVNAGVDAKRIGKAVLTSPDGKGHVGVAKALGLDPKTVVDPRTDWLGMLGTPQPFVMMAEALSKSSAAELMLVACYGDGCDALVFEVKPGVEAFKRRSRTTDSPVQINYTKYLAFKQLLSECQDESRPFASPIQQGREAPLSIRLHGRKCHKCATINTLNLRVCPECGTRDRFDDVKLSRKGVVNTYTQEHYYPTPEPPVTLAVIDLENGGRYLSQMTDADASEVNVGMKVRMAFRRLHDGGGYHNYCWKCRPVREAGK